MATPNLHQNQPRHNPQFDRKPVKLPTTPPPFVDGDKLLEVFLRLTEPKPEEVRKGGAK